MRKRFMILLASLGLVIGTSVLPASATDDHGISYLGCTVMTGFSQYAPVQGGYASYVSDGAYPPSNPNDPGACRELMIQTVFICSNVFGFVYPVWDFPTATWETNPNPPYELVIQGNIWSGGTDTAPCWGTKAYFGKRIWMRTWTQGRCYADLWNTTPQVVSGVSSLTACTV